MKALKIVFIALLSLNSIWSCSSSNNNKTAEQAPSNLPQSMPAKSTSSPTFVVADLKGNSHTFEEFKGKGPLMLNFWGTWCPPCRRELPDLVKIYEEYKPKGLEIVGLAVKDTPEKVRQFAGENNLNWVMLMANMDAMVSFGATQGVPTTIFFDKNGFEKARYIGARSYEDFKAEVEKIL